jgi:hypothetical protein
MELSINTPALLFPAITLLMLAYTNRFLGLATLIRNLPAKYKQIQEDKEVIVAQINNLNKRLVLIRRMQIYGIVSFFLRVEYVFYLYTTQRLGSLYFRSEFTVLTFFTSTFIIRNFYQYKSARD